VKKFDIKNNHVLQKTSKNVALAEVRRVFQLSFLKQRGLKPHHNVLDIGCGWLRGGLPVIDYLDEGRFYGFEMSIEDIENGKRELKSHNLEHKRPTIIHNPGPSQLVIDTDIKFDFITAFYVLYHMHDDVLESCFESVHQMLADDGSFYAVIHHETHPQFGKHRTPDVYPMYFLPYKYYFDKAEKMGFDVEDIGCIGDYGHKSGFKKQDEQRMLRLWKK
jgi:cyclopropane fatty-acyl-phospholipid synthase-like methyltransferase